MDELQRRKLAHNEALFREVNEAIAAVRPSYRQTRFICECADDRCARTIVLERREYERIRANELRFFVLPGHERPEIERVVDRYDDYLVVEKLEPLE